MSLTLAVPTSKLDVADREEILLDITFDSSYPAGGEALVPTDLPFRTGGIQIDNIDFTPQAGYVFDYDHTNQKVQVREDGTSFAAYTAAGLAIGTDKTKVLIANTVTFAIAAEFASRTTAETAFTATDHDITAVVGSVQEAVYLLSVDANANVTITKGTTATGAAAGVVPAVPAGECAIGHVRIAVDAGSTDFDASSDDLDAAHLTVAYTDLTGTGQLREVLATTDLSALTTRAKVLGR